MITETNFDYEKYVVASNGYKQVIDFFSYKHDKSEMVSSVYSDLVEDYTAYRNRLQSDLENDIEMNEDNWKVIAKHLINGRDMMIEEHASNIQVYPVNRAIKSIRDDKADE